MALEALHVAVMEHDETRELRAWKLFSVLPFWLLLRPGYQGRVGRDELLRRFNLFEEGHWDRLHAEATQVPQHLPSQRTMTPEQRAKAACQKVRVGEVSRARQCLTGAALAPRTQETLHELQHRRPQVQPRAVPEDILEHAATIFLDRSKFLASMRGAPRGSSPGPGGCTYEHLKILLDDTDTTELFMSACERLAPGKIPVDNRNALMGPG